MSRTSTIKTQDGTQRTASGDSSRSPGPLPLLLRVFRWHIRNVGRVAPGLMGRLGVYLWFKPMRRPKIRAEQAAVLKRAHVRELQSGTEVLKAYTWGARDRPAVFLMHGWEGRAAQLAGFVDPLLDAGYRVVALDAPGHGKNPKRRVFVHELTAAISQTAEVFGPFEAVVTHSLGTLWTSVVMGREQWPTRRAVCIAPVTSMDPLVDVMSAMLDFPPAVETRVRDGVNAALADDFWDHSAIRVPALLCHDCGDQFIPYEVGKELSQAWPDARLHTTEGLGHKAILANPDVIAAAVAFLCTGSPAATSQRAGNAA